MTFIATKKPVSNRGVAIYCLVNPITRNIFYVGKTKRRIESRLSAHIQDKGVNARKDREINNIIESGRRPLIETLELCDESKWEDREVFWISEIKRLGFSITNGNKGGSGTHNFLDRTRLAISTALLSSEKKKEADRKRIGVAHSESRIEAIRKAVRNSEKFASKKGATLPIAWRKAISDGRKKSPAAMQQLKNIHQSKIGVPVPDSVKAKIRFTLMNSESARLAQKADSAKKMGTPQSQEQKRGIALYNIRRKKFKEMGYSESESRKLASRKGLLHEQV